MFTEIQEHFPEKCQTIDPDKWDNIYVVGDVHGCSEEFRELIQLIDLQDTELLVTVGDVIRKGPDNAGALNIVRNNPNILSVLGNNEVKFLAGRKSPDGLNEDDKKFIDTWPLVITWPGNAVVHGGFDPDRKVEKHSVHDVVNMRSPKKNNNYDTPFWFDEFDGDIRFFFGHTVTNQPIHQDNAVAIDTGCVYGGKLTAYDTNRDHFISVDAKKVYEARDASKYADNLRKTGSAPARLAQSEDVKSKASV